MKNGFQQKLLGKMLRKFKNLIQTDEILKIVNINFFFNFVKLYKKG